MGSLFGFWLKKMAFLFRSFLVAVSALFLALVGHAGRIFFRYHEVEDSTTEKLHSSDSSVILKEDDRTDTISTERRPEQAYSDNWETVDSNGNNFDERKTSDFVFRFHFPTYEEFCKSRKEISDFSVSPMSNNHEFLLEKSATLLVEESFEVESDNDSLKTARFLSEKDLTEEKEEISVAGDVPFDKDQSAKLLNNSLAEKCRSEKEFTGSDSYSDLISSSNENNLTGEKEEIIVAEDFSSDIHRSEMLLNSSLAEKGQPEMEFTGSDSYADSMSSSNDLWGTSELITTSSDGLLSDMDSEEDLHLTNMNFGYNPDDSEEDEEFQFLKESNPKNPVIENSGKNSNTSSANQVISSNGLKKTETEDSSAMDSDDPNSLETLWEHQDLLEQLKMELKKVKAIGLPTIFEESESPKITEDLKPWKIDEKFEHGDLIDELHKFYKSYRERMRKLDILNYQKMYAIGFLQPKDSVKSFSSISKSTAPSIASLLSNYRNKKPGIDPMKKFMTELYRDLEMIYVGQMCLSWEFIQWQYDKALDLWESEPYGIHLYNNVAGEFQQFQVILQRFVENEPFEGPRIESYIKNRCLTRNLLQVPLIREDTTGGRKKKGKDDYAITTADLIEILQESIRVVWRFIRADKLSNEAKNNTIIKSRKGSRTELQNPADSQLLENIQSELQRKKRKVKEMERSGNCILKRFQKGEGRESSEQHLYFFSQVDMKVVSRVLKMSRLTTDQLFWCQNKLSRISFSSRRKIGVEPSFFLFPC